MIEPQWAGGKSYVLNNLKIGSTYEFKVQAVNLVGTSAESSTFSILYNSPAPPSYPYNLKEIT